MSCWLASLQNIWANHDKLMRIPPRVRSSELAINCCSTKWPERCSILGSRKDFVVFCSCLHRKSEKFRKITCLPNTSCLLTWLSTSTIIWQNGFTCSYPPPNQSLSWKLSLCIMGCLSCRPKYIENIPFFILFRQRCTFCPMIPWQITLQQKKQPLCPKLHHPKPKLAWGIPKNTPFWTGKSERILPKHLGTNFFWFRGAGQRSLSTRPL